MENKVTEKDLKKVTAALIAESYGKPVVEMTPELKELTTLHNIAHDLRKAGIVEKSDFEKVGITSVVSYHEFAYDLASNASFFMGMDKSEAAAKSAYKMAMEVMLKDAK